MIRRSVAVVSLAALAFLAAGCRSYRIDATVENRSGAPVDLLEVDYPSASFGEDRLADGADYHYRFEVRDSGPVKVQYTEHATHIQRQATGPELQEKQVGQLEIVLLPGGVIQFHPQLSGPS
ncbi:MAG TPA: hypothetical protein VG893_10485 [Terracidiphilus sp.]|nr:hypothetical protein [Terracidiphilus sp.]